MATNNQKLLNLIEKKKLNAVSKLSKALDKLLNWMGVNFYIFPDEQLIDNMRMCMHPHWNIDRACSGNPEDSQKYNEAVERQNALAFNVTEYYKLYRKLIKYRLFL